MKVAVDNCTCARPRVLDEPWHCHRCGHDVQPPRVGRSTWNLAIAIARHILRPGRTGDVSGAQNRHPREGIK